MTNQIKKQIKRDFTKKNEIISWSFQEDGSLTMVSVTMPSTCESGQTMTWDFMVSINEGNEDCFTEMEKYQFPEMIEKTTFNITQI